MLMFFICLSKNRRDLIEEQIFGTFSTPFNIEKVLINNLVLATNLFYCLLFSRT